MIHILDLLDIASYLIKPNEKIDVSYVELIKLKKKIEENLTSVEVEIDDCSVRRFERKYMNEVKVHKSFISIHFNDNSYRELIKLRTPYMSEHIQELIINEGL